MQPPPLQLVSALAFPHGADDLLALAGEALSSIWRPDGQMRWQFPQGVMRRPPPDEGSFFTALATYTTGAYDGGGTMQHWNASIQLTVSAAGFERDGQYYQAYTIDAAAANADSSFELHVMVACLRLTQRMLDRGWILAHQRDGLWRMPRRGWSDYLLTRTGQDAEFDLMWALQRHGLFPMVTVHDPGPARDAVIETIAYRRQFER